MGTLTSPTLDGLIASTRRILGQEDENNSSWSNIELEEYLNEAVRRYFTEVIQSSEGLFTTSTTLNLVSGANTVACPSDFFEVVRLFKVRDNGYNDILPYDNSFNTSYNTTSGGTSTTFRPSYRLLGNNIFLNTTPAFSETGGLRLEYIAFPTTMVDGGDTMTSSVSPIFKDLIIMYCVYKAKVAESLRGNGINTYAPAQEQLNDLYAAFKQVISERSHYPSYTQAYNPEEF